MLGLFSPGAGAVPNGCTSMWSLGAWARVLPAWVLCSREAISTLLKLLRLIRRDGGFWHMSPVLAGAAGSSGIPVAALQV